MADVNRIKQEMAEANARGDKATYVKLKEELLKEQKRRGLA